MLPPVLAGALILIGAVAAAIGYMRTAAALLLMAALKSIVSP